LKITDAGRRILRGITPAVEAAHHVILRGRTEKDPEELARLLQKAVAAGDDLNRAPLRDAALPSQQQSQERVRIGPQLNGCEGCPRTGRNLQSNWTAPEDAYAKLAESEAIRSNVRESLNETKRFSSLPSWKQ